MPVTGIEPRPQPPGAGRETCIRHERDVHLAYERGREDSHAFPALLCGILIGATSVSAAAWILL